jgi:hypothetical protein
MRGTVELHAMVASSADAHAAGGAGLGSEDESYRVNEVVLPSANALVVLSVAIAAGAANVTEAVPETVFATDVEVALVVELDLALVLVLDPAFDAAEVEDDDTAAASWALRRSCQTLSCAD